MCPPIAVISSAILIGCGLGGLVDGIGFHQLLQVHNMPSARYPTKGVSAEIAVVNVEINMFWDGLFHSLTYIMTVAGVALLWRAGARRDVPWSGKTFVGALFLGWGLFNFVEGVIDHHILNIHHVVESHGQSVFDYAFLASGIIFIIGGWMAIRSARTDGAQPRGAVSAR